MRSEGAYTYIHRRKSDGLVFYVGKGRGRRAAETKSRNAFWRNTVEKHGLVIEVCAAWPTDAEALAHEEFLISTFKAMGHPLCNLTPGGERGGGRYARTPEWRERNSRLHKGKSVSEETRAKIRAANTGRRLGPRSPEVVQKIAAVLRGKPKPSMNKDNATESVRRGWNNLTHAPKGQPLPREWVENISKAHKGKPWSDARRAAHERRKKA